MRARRFWIGAMALLGSRGIATGYEFDPRDFATAVVNYVPGEGVGNDFISGEPFTNAAAALGRPTVDTSGDGFFVPVNQPSPVVAVSGPFRASELVTIGRGGQLTLRFDRRIENEAGNPFGLDFIIYGNTSTGSSDAWVNGDPSSVSVGAGLFSEPGRVSVSQDGVTWHAFASGPFADGFAPTLGRVYDPGNPDGSIGAFNQWWGAPTNPTRPVDPAVNEGTLLGKTVAEAALLYGGAAGGTGFDLSSVGLEWAQFVRIENPVDSTVSPDIDAVADVIPVPEPTGPSILTAALPAMLSRRRSR